MPTFEYQAQHADGRVVNGTAFGVSPDQVVRDLLAKGLDVQRIGVAVNPNDPLAGVTAFTAPAPLRPAAVAQPAPRERPSEEVPQFEPVFESGAMVGAEPPRMAEVSERGEVGRIEGAPPTEQRSYMQTAVWGPLVGTVPLTAVQFFFRQASTMFEAGVPIVQSLETLAGQSSSPKLRGIIHELAGHVKAGRSLSVGLQRYPEVFSPVVVSLVRAGESGGFLDEAMTITSDYLERDIALRNLYKRLMFYPKIQLALSIIIILAANLIITSLGGKEKLYSPLTNPVTWVFLTPIIIAYILFTRVGLANPAVKYNFDAVASRLPYLGNTIRQVAMARFGRAFGALYKGGVPLQKALTLSADACGNEFLRARMYTAGGKMESGHGIAETFRSTQAFSPIVLDMVGTGETTGNLDFMLNKMAAFSEDEAATRTIKTAYIMGTILGLLVAIYIGYIVISFWTAHYGTVGQELSG
jgi:type II secretory pathway component PulF